MNRRALLLSLVPGLLCAQVTYERLAAAAKEPENWLTYSGGYASQRYSTLAAITRATSRRWNRSGSSRPRACRSSRPRPW